MNDRKTAVRSASTLLSELDYRLRRGRGRELAHVPLGYNLLDDVLGGGIRPGDLVLVGGTPGVGKTVSALQWARNVAMTGRQTVFVCYEHGESELLVRLLSVELGELKGIDPGEGEKLRMRLEQTALAQGTGISDLFGDSYVAETVQTTFETYASNLHLVRGSGSRTGVPEIEALLESLEKPVLFVDYLQKVAVQPEPVTEDEKVTRVVESLKDLALRWEVPIVCITAADREGLQVRRMRSHHLRGSAALMYEADIVIIMNEKRNAVSKAHLVYDPVRAGTFADWVVFSLEKNRSGPALVDLEFKKDFAHYRFDPTGDVVAERLVDERIEANV